MAEHGEMIGPATLRFRREFAAPIERVWEFFLDPELRKQWFCAGHTDRHVGGRIVLDFDHSRLSDRRATSAADEEEGISTFEGEITECDPPRRFAFTWPNMPGQQHTEVTVELADIGSGKTEMILTHTGLDSAAFRLGAIAGWHAHLHLLDDRLAGRERSDFWDLHEALEDEYREILRKSGHLD